MRKTDPRLIVNVNIKDEELEEKIKIATDEYLDKVLNSDDFLKRVHSAIDRIVDREIELYIMEAEKNPSYRWSPQREHVMKRVNKIIDDLIDERVKKKLVDEILSRLNILDKEDNS